jgi:beta-lactamase regulating signal transducer with metallopeptidase domain
MSSLFALRALLFAGECFAASALLMSLAWLASKFIRQASVRHFVWLTAFGTMLMLPVAALLVPPRIVFDRKAETPSFVPGYIGKGEPMGSNAAAPVEFASPSVATTARSTPKGWLASPPAIEAGDIAGALFAVWLAGIGWTGLRLLAGAFCLGRLKHRSRPHALAPGEHPRLASSRRECELRLSLSESGPLTFGILKPVILLPRDAAYWPRERLQAVLLHELAHVRRRDSLTQALAMIVSAFYWPNPLVWLGLRALRREAEMAADDAAIACGMRPSAYAGELLRIATTFKGRRVAFSSVAMASQSSLEARVKSVLAPNQLRAGVSTMDGLKIVCFGIAATALLAVFRPDMVEAVTPAQPAPVAEPAERAAPPATPQAPTIAEPVAEPAPAATPDDAGNADEESAVATVSPKIAHDHRHHVHILRIKDGKVMEDAFRDIDRAEIRRAMSEARAEARKARAELARLKPTIDRAIAEARIGEHIAAAMVKAQPAIDAKVRAALAKAQPEIDRAIAEARISERVARAIREAQPRIDAAMVRIQKGMDKHGDIVIEREDRDNDADMDGDQDEGDNDADNDSDSDSPSEPE